MSNRKTIKIITIIGARPQFIKATMISRAIISFNQIIGYEAIEEKILHSGQHYDDNMSDIFFRQLNIPRPTWLLNGKNHTVEELQQLLYPIISSESPDYVLVYGDTNTTLAGALAAEQAKTRIIHIEAGLRSFNNSMPEEHNRIETDRRSHILFCPTTTAIENLKRENITNNVYKVGDVMYDAALCFTQLAQKRTNEVLKKYNIASKKFNLMTVHRAESTDNSDNLLEIIYGINKVSTNQHPTIWPIHPRTSAVIKSNIELKNTISENIIIIPPLSFLDMIILEKEAYKILTDSGGIQKEAYFHKTPCVTLRKETEWIETVTSGWNQIAGYSAENIVNCYYNAPKTSPVTEYGDGNSAKQIIDLIWLKSF